MSFPETPANQPISSMPVPEAQKAWMDSTILRLLMESIPDRIYFKDLQSRFVRVNQSHAEFLGLKSPDEIIGKNDFDFFAPVHAKAAYAVEQEIIRGGSPFIGRVERIVKQDGRETWGSTTKIAWPDPNGRIIGTFGLTRDVTAVKQAEEKLSDERNLLRTIIDHLPSRIFVKDLESRFLINNLSHLHWLGVESQEELASQSILDLFPGERGQRAIADDRQVMSGGQPIHNKETSDLGPVGQSRWSLTTKVALRDSRKKIVGLVGISHDITERKQIEQELQRRTEQMEEDLRMARQVQESFFPKIYPTFPSGVPTEASALRFAHRYIPASSLGGDFFDIIPLSDSRCAVLVCDVMGHGVRAGFLTALIRGVVREIGTQAEFPSHVLREINRGLTPIMEQVGQPLFATTFFGVVDTITETIVFCNAGHPPPLILRRETGSVVLLNLPEPEPAAGMIENFSYTEHMAIFRPGDVLVGFTDGLFEADDPTGSIFGEERVRGLISENTSMPITSMIDMLVTEAQAFTGRREFEDDVCVVAVEATGMSCCLDPGTYQI